MGSAHRGKSQLAAMQPDHWLEDVGKESCGCSLVRGEVLICVNKAFTGNQPVSISPLFLRTHA